MKQLIRSARILDPASPYHRKRMDILIEDGRIEKIAEKIEDTEAKELRVPDAHLSIGWMDLFANFCEPGFEHREDITTGLQAAAAGGFTSVVMRPDTNPALHSKSEIEFVINKSANHPVNLLPLGALTRNLAGSELTEMIDLHHAGAVAFSNGQMPLANSGILMRALQYLKPFGGRLWHHALKRSLSSGPVNESEISVMMGMKGSPAMAEELAVKEAIELADYTQTPLHLVKISTAGSVALVREAKSRGIPVTASVTAHHLLFSDAKVIDFDENYKVDPPLRRPEDVEALRKGVLEGVIDAIVSDHEPWEREEKMREFELAASGIAGIQTVFPMALEALGDLESVILHLSIGPRKVMGRKLPSIQEGEVADLTLFSPTFEWIPSNSPWYSKSRIHPGWTRKWKGKSFAIFSKGQCLEV